MTTGTVVATPRKPPVSVLERLATLLTIIAALILAAYFLVRVGVLRIDPSVTWESIAVLVAPLGASVVGLVAAGCNWIGRRRLRKWARQVRKQAKPSEEEKAERRTRDASMAIGVPASVQNIPDYLRILQQTHLLPALFTTVVVVAAVGTTVVTAGPRVPAVTFTLTLHGG